MTGATGETVQPQPLSSWPPRASADDPAQQQAAPESAHAAGGRPVVCAGVAHPVPILARDRMPPGETVTGPAIVEEDGSSTVVPPGWSVALDSIGCLVLRRNLGAAA